MPSFATGLTAGPCNSELLACDTASDGLEMLSDYLTGKAPSTLIKRANSRIFMQNMLNQLGYFWTMSEPDSYRFLKTLRSAGHSTSRLKSLLEAVTFCRYSFHLPKLHDLTVSQRCLGAVVDNLSGKVKQAEPLTVSDVKQLHWGFGTWKRLGQSFQWRCIVLHICKSPLECFHPRELPAAGLSDRW